MNLQDQAEADRQIALCDKRQHMIEAGTLKTLQPMAGDTVPGVPLVSSDRCPSCDRAMSWYPMRRAYLCLHCQ